LSGGGSKYFSHVFEIGNPRVGVTPMQGE
jgi:hypothetical protein